MRLNIDEGDGGAAIRCGDGCGAAVADEKAAGEGGWELLSISSRWRCPACYRALVAARTMRGRDGETADTLPPQSRGSLRKSTAETIAAPSVKG